MHDFCIPRNDYLLDLAGRWMKIQVSKVEKAIVSVVALKFQAHREEKLKQVFFFFHVKAAC